MGLATPTGLRHAILCEVQNGKYTGYMVKPTQHWVVLEPASGDIDEVVMDYPEERGIVISGEQDDVVIFKDDEGTYVAVVGNEDQGRTVKSAAGALKVACDFFSALGEYEISNTIRDQKTFYIPYLADLLGIPE